MEKLIDVGEVADLKAGATYVERPGLRCVLFKSAKGIHAFSNLCPHLGGPMERCEVEGMVVSCPLHGWQFDLEDGGREINGYQPLRMFDLSQAGGRLIIRQEVASPKSDSAKTES
jgi:nitrite reductase/ring-hydroxylating ferredoxin subunit